MKCISVHPLRGWALMLLFVLLETGCDDPSYLLGYDAGSSVGQDAGLATDAGVLEQFDAGFFDAGDIDAGPQDAGPRPCLYPDEGTWLPFDCEADQDTCDAVGDAVGPTADGYLNHDHKDIVGTWSAESEDGETFFIYIRFAALPYRYCSRDRGSTAVVLRFYEVSPGLAPLNQPWLVSLADALEPILTYPPQSYAASPRSATSICTDVALSLEQPILRFALPRSFVSRFDDRVEYSVEVQGITPLVVEYATNGPIDGLAAARVRSRGGRPDINHESFVSVCELVCPTSGP